MSVSGIESKIKFYLDKECKHPIKEVNWDKQFYATMLDGKVEVLKNTVEVGDTATATFYVRNESNLKFGVEQLIFPDKRVNKKIESNWLLPFVPTKITLSVKLVPDEHEVVETVKPAEFKIRGFFVIED